MWSRKEKSSLAIASLFPSFIDVSSKRVGEQIIRKYFMPEGSVGYFLNMGSNSSKVTRS